MKLTTKPTSTTMTALPVGIVQHSDARRYHRRDCHIQMTTEIRNATIQPRIGIILTIVRQTPPSGGKRDDTKRFGILSHRRRFRITFVPTTQTMSDQTRKPMTAITPRRRCHSACRSIPPIPAATAARTMTLTDWPIAVVPRSTSSKAFDPASSRQPGLQSHRTLHRPQPRARTV